MTLNNTYIYIGPSTLWPFVTSTARTLLTPLRWLRVGKLDFAPLVGMSLVLAICYPIENWTELTADPKTTLPGLISPGGVQ